MVEFGWLMWNPHSGMSSPFGDRIVSPDRSDIRLYPKSILGQLVIQKDPVLVGDFHAHPRCVSQVPSDADLRQFSVAQDYLQVLRAGTIESLSSDYLVKNTQQFNIVQALVSGDLLIIKPQIGRLPYETWDQQEEATERLCSEYLRWARAVDQLVQAAGESEVAPSKYRQIIRDMLPQLPETVTSRVSFEHRTID